MKKIILILLIAFGGFSYGQDTNQLLIKDGYVLKVYSEPEQAISVPRTTPERTIQMSSI